MIDIRSNKRKRKKKTLYSLFCPNKKKNSKSEMLTDRPQRNQTKNK